MVCNSSQLDDFSFRERPETVTTVKYHLQVSSFLVSPTPVLSPKDPNFDLYQNLGVSGLFPLC